MNTAPEMSLYDALLLSGRLSAEQKATVERLFAAHAADPPKLADELLAQKLITKYMHRKIQSNRAGELVFGQYLILERIGEGGMGKVYRAVETRLGREVALKTIRPNLLANRTVIQRYKREARAAASLKHPNIVELYEADDVGGRYYLAMEFVDGSDLSRLVKDLVKDKTVMPAGEAAEYIRQAALGLQHAHDKDLVHRDIKPSNLLVRGERAIPGSGGKANVKILDMGLVRSLTEDDASTTDLTRDGTVVGTPDYMAPEQGRNSSTVDPRADIYSLGCTLFYLLRGSPPYDSGTAIDKLIKHQLDPVPDIRKYRPDVPPGLAAVIRRMMAKQPEERFQTCDEVARELAMYTGDAALFDFTNPAPTFQPVDFAPASSPATPDSIPTATPAATDSTTRGSVRLVARPGTGPQSGGPKSVRPSLKAKPIVKRPADPTPSGDVSKPTASRVRRTPPTGTGSPRRPTRKPARKPTGGVPVLAVAAAGVAAVALIVVLALLLTWNRNTGPSPTTAELPPPPPPPAEVSQFRPVHELLPDDTAAILIADPKAYWDRAKFDLDLISPTRRQAEVLARAFEFDPRKFDRVVVAFQPDMTRCVAAGEGEVLRGESFRHDLDKLRWGTPEETANGVTLVRPRRDPMNPFNPGKRVRVALLPEPPAYLLGSPGMTLADLYADPATHPRPTGIDPLLTEALADVDQPDQPLAFFVASGKCELPLKPNGSITPLKTSGVDRLTLAARAGEKQVQVTLTLVGPDGSRLRRFLEVDLTAALEGFIGRNAGKPLADAIRQAAESAPVTDDGGLKKLTAKFSWEWRAIHAAADAVIPPPFDR